MTDEKAIPEDDALNSYIVIRFAAPGATLMNVTMTGVYPGQMIIAGDYLMREGHRIMDMIRQQQEEQEKTSQIVKPTPKIIVPK